MNGAWLESKKSSQGHLKIKIILWDLPFHRLQWKIINQNYGKNPIISIIIRYEDQTQQSKIG